MKKSKTVFTRSIKSANSSNNFSLNSEEMSLWIFDTIQAKYPSIKKLNSSLKRKESRFEISLAR